MRVRKRTCTNPPPSGEGKKCKGPTTKTESCNTQTCKKNTALLFRVYFVKFMNCFTILELANSALVLRLSSCNFMLIFTLVKRTRICKLDGLSASNVDKGGFPLSRNFHVCK